MHNSTLKRFLSFALLMVIGLPAGHSASDQAKAKDHQKTIQGVLKAGQIATSTNGYSMKAKLDGKEWVATAMMSPEATGRILGNKGDEFIGLPFHRSHLIAGKTVKFGEDQAVDLRTADAIAFWSGRTGEMTYTKVDENSAEGTFFFTATARETTKKIQVTEGKFRILLGKK
jgi:hypothetical protein